MYLNGKVGPAIKHRSERKFAVPPLQQLLIALRFYTTACFQMIDEDLFGVHKSTFRIVSTVALLEEEDIHGHLVGYNVYACRSTFHL